MAGDRQGFLKISFNENCTDSERKRSLPFANSDLYRVKIKYAAKLTHGEEVKDIYDVALGIKDISYSFHPGDTIGILPNNDLEEVFKILKLLNCLDLINKQCSIILLDTKKLRSVSHLPVKTTLKDIFLKCIDIRSLPRKSFLKTLSTYTENIQERHMLEKLSSQSNSVEYIDFISNNGCSLLNLLETFPSCKVPIEVLLENLPPLQPRPYSISSSPLVENEVHITFSVQYFDKVVKGVCTGWLENIIAPILKNKEAEKPFISFYFRKPNAFRLNLDDSVPIIMIGPGTGVAPFRGFIEHLYLMKRTLDTWLFYGCRYKDRDFLYKFDFEKYLHKKYLSKASVAFSRDQDTKVYVQDLIRSEAVEIFKAVVHKNATIYVCGDIKDMMKDVRRSIKYCLVENGLLEVEADLFILEMVKKSKYIEDKWF